MLHVCLFSSPRFTTTEPKKEKNSWNLTVYSSADFAYTSQFWLKFGDNGQYVNI
jgi:hypothetical protein